MNSASDEIHVTVPRQRAALVLADVDGDLDALTEPHACELGLGDVGAHVDRLEIRDLVERLPRLDELARPCVGRQHGARDRIDDGALADALAELRDLRLGGGHLLTRGVLLRARGVDLLRAGGNLPVLRLDLLAERPDVPLRLIELRRGRGLLRVEALHALVGALGDLVLRRERRALRDGRVALGAKRLDLLLDLGYPRSVGRLLRGRLIALQLELGPVDRADRRAGGKSDAFVDVERQDLAARLGGDDDFRRFDVSVRIGLLGAGASGRKRQHEYQGAHQRTSNPSVVRKRARACARSTR